jgi:hypothetical protein
MEKTAKKTGLLFHAARYEDANTTDGYFIVLYSAGIDPDEHPHDWEISFSKKEWHKLGMKVPPKEGPIGVVMQMKLV